MTPNIKILLVADSTHFALTDVYYGYLNALQKLNINKESRFDVITVIKKVESYEIDHIEGAFYPTLR